MSQDWCCFLYPGIWESGVFIYKIVITNTERYSHCNKLSDANATHMHYRQWTDRNPIYLTSCMYLCFISTLFVWFMFLFFVFVLFFAFWQKTLIDVHQYIDILNSILYKKYFLVIERGIIKQIHVDKLHDDSETIFHQNVIVLLNSALSF